jgi:predicted secreted protein
MTRPIFCVLALVAVLAEGCGDDAARERGADATPTPAPAPAPRTITERDSGAEFTLATGAETSLRLTSDYAWSEPTVSGDAVELTRVDYFQDPGFSEWIVQAVSAGTATIAARGTPAGAGGPDTPLRFQVKIVVAR